MERYRQALGEAEPYVTRDGSVIRELMHPSVHGNAAQSLAEARVVAGTTTRAHLHRHSEELYFILAGRGRMELGERCFEVGPGDTVCIPPGTRHCIGALGDEELRFLCCCAPAYRHEDTQLL